MSLLALNGLSRTEFPGVPRREAGSGDLPMTGAPQSMWTKLASRIGRLDARSAAVAADAWLVRHGWLLVLALAILYYAQYYRSGMNLSGEGGTAAVIALRLLEGQRPIADTFLGYNVMWFYPVVWLFKVVGPSYVALRIFFFAICTCSGLLAFFTLRRATRLGVLSVGVAALVVLIPGMIFRNYMPFLGLLNIYLLLQAYVFQQKSVGRQILWMVSAGLGVGLTYLIRVDLGLFFTIIMLGLGILAPVILPGKVLRLVGLSSLGTVLALAAAVLLHLPVYLDARTRGFDQQFVGQYLSWFHLVRTGLFSATTGASDAPAGVAPAPGDGGAVSEPAPEARPDAPERAIDRSSLQRPAMSDAWTLPVFYDRAFAAIIHLPVLVAPLFVGIFSVTFLSALLRRQREASVDYLTVLTALGCSLTLFPQYYFFRPDTPHLSEFMAPFLVALALAGWCAVRRFRAAGAVGLVVIVLVLSLSILDAGLYVYHSFPKESAGTIAAKNKRRYEFVAENGVRVWLKKKELAEMQGVYDLLRTRTKPGEYIVCYPYAPTINFFANRPSYEYNLYIDNATAGADFHQETLAELAKYAPAAIVIDNREINKNDASQFSQWAADTYEYIRTHYHLGGTFGRQEVYLRDAPAKLP